MIVKKKLVLAFAFSFVTIASLACDICGCGVGGGYIGILPGFRKRFISVRYAQNGLTSHLGPGGGYTYLTSRESFRTAELWGAANIGKRFRVAGFVPYSFLERKNSMGNYSRSGISDISLVGYYQVLDKQAAAGNKMLVQSLWVGAGVKLPSGQYNDGEKNVQDGVQNTFQLGTGSLDYSLHAMYDIRLQDAGINVNASYRFNTPNKYDYKYGDKLTTNILAYYKFRLSKSCAIAPNTGVLYESAKKDHKTSEIQVWQTGGRSLMGTLGLELSIGRTGLGMNYQAPLSQQLGEGKIMARDRGMAYVSFSF